MPKRKVNYPPAKTATKGGNAAGQAREAPLVRPTVATIDMTARAGKSGFSVGDRVRITAAGFASGETAVIESLAAGVIPAAVVRTAGGQARRVRTIDLEPVTEAGEPEQPPPTG